MLVTMQTASRSEDLITMRTSQHLLHSFNPTNSLRLIVTCGVDLISYASRVQLPIYRTPCIANSRILLNQGAGPRPTLSNHHCDKVLEYQPFWSQCNGPVDSACRSKPRLHLRFGERHKGHSSRRFFGTSCLLYLGPLKA